MRNTLLRRVGLGACALAALVLVLGNTGCGRKTKTERRTVIVEEREERGEVREVPPGDEMIVE